MSFFPSKRKDLHSKFSRSLFYIYFLYSITLLVWLFIQDFSIHITLIKSYLSAGIDDYQWSGSFQPIFMTNPLSLLIIIPWSLVWFVLLVTFGKKMKTLFYLFSALSITTLVVYLFWIPLLTMGLDREVAFEEISLSQLVITKLVIVWGVFTTWMSYVLISRMYSGVFNRIQYLFESISRGNWDANMFFREYDAFNFVASSFNKAKNRYLDVIYGQDLHLIQLKDFIEAKDWSEQSKTNLLNDLSSNTDQDNGQKDL